MANLSFIIAGIGIGAALFGVISSLYSIHTIKQEEKRQLKRTISKHDFDLSYLSDKANSHFKLIADLCTDVTKLKKEVVLLNERLNQTVTTETQAD